MQQTQSTVSASRSVPTALELLDIAQKYRRLAAILAPDEPSRASLIATAALFEAGSKSLTPLQADP